MLGSFEHSLGNAQFDTLHSRLHSKAATKVVRKSEQRLSQVVEREWSELPYAMMRLTAARRPWDSNRVYWRDRVVQLGDIDLNLLAIQADDDAPRYIATYTQDELRHDFALDPSLKAGVLLWNLPGLCDTAKLTTEHLAEKLLARLVTFYTTGLS